MSSSTNAFVMTVCLPPDGNTEDLDGMSNRRGRIAEYVGFACVICIRRGETSEIFADVGVEELHSAG